MDRRQFFASSIASSIAAPVAARLRPELSTTYLSLYCVWFDNGHLYCAATRDFPQREWELYFAYYQGGARSVVMPLDVRQALLDSNIGAYVPEHHGHSLLLRSTMSPQEVIRRCEQVMANRKRIA